MHVLIVTNVFEPDRAGGAAVFTDLALALVDKGHEVTVYTAHPYYPEWKRKSSISPWALQTEYRDGMKIVRHGLAIPSRPASVVGRLTLEGSFSFSLLRSSWRDRDVDVVITFCPLMASVVFTLIRAVFRRSPLWLNVQDIPADAALGSGLTRSALLHRAATRIQSWLFARFDLVSTISPVMVERLTAISRGKTRVELIPNWLHRSLATEVEDLPPKSRCLGDPVNLLYAGNIGMKQGLTEFCQRLYETGAPFRLRIFGNGAGANEVAAWIAQRQDPRFSIGPLLSEPDFVRALHDADFFVITEREGAGASFVPSKLIPALAVGTPVFGVCDADGPLGVELRRFELGIQCEWSGLDDGVTELSELGNEPQSYERLIDRCLARSQYYDRNGWYETIADRLSTLACSR